MQNQQTFNDGVLTIYHVSNTAEPGHMPEETLEIIKGNIRFSEMKVGVIRFWTAKQNTSQASRLLRIPFINQVELYQVVNPGDERLYKIIQAQIVKDTLPKCLDLTLERIEAVYEIK